MINEWLIYYIKPYLILLVCYNLIVTRNKKKVTQVSPVSPTQNCVITTHTYINLPSFHLESQKGRFLSFLPIKYVIKNYLYLFTYNVCDKDCKTVQIH